MINEYIFKIDSFSAHLSWSQLNFSDLSVVVVNFTFVYNLRGSRVKGGGSGPPSWKFKVNIDIKEKKYVVTSKVTPKIQARIVVF